jgi:hypothetical protein
VHAKGINRRQALKVLGAAGATVAAWAAQIIPEIALASSASSKGAASVAPMTSAEATAGFAAFRSSPEIVTLHDLVTKNGYAERLGATQGARFAGKYSGRFFSNSYRHLDGRTAILMVAAPDASTTKTMLFEDTRIGPNDLRRRVHRIGSAGEIVDVGTVTRSGSIMTVNSEEDGVTRVIDLNHLNQESGAALVGVIQAEASSWGCAVCQFGFGALIGLPCFIGTAALCLLACSVTAEVCAIPCGVIFWALCYVGAWAGAWDLCWWIGQCP